MPERYNGGGGPLRLWSYIGAVHAALLVGWLVVVAQHGLPHGDWATWRLAAERAFSGQLDAVWATDFDAVTLDRWFYPPFALWFYRPLVGLSDGATFAICAGLQILAGALGFGLLVRELRLPEAIAFPAALIFFGSAAFCYDVMLGQNGATLLCAYALAIVALRRGRGLWAGLALAPLGIKPGFVLAPAAALLWRERRAFAGFALAGAALVASGLPFGAQAWADFLVSVQNQADYATTGLGGRHNVTVRGFLLALTGSPQAARILWALALVPAVAAFARVVARGDAIRSLSATVLFTVSTSVYVNAYDGVLLLLPALDLAARPPADPRLARGLWGAIFVAWLWDERTWLWPLTGLVSPGEISLVGVLSFAWLLAWATSPGASRSPA